MDKLSYASDSSTSAWNTYLQQIERVAPYLGELSPWVDTLRHPKRALIVDIPVQMDDGTIVISKDIACSTTSPEVRVKAVFATILTLISMK